MYIRQQIYIDNISDQQSIRQNNISLLTLKILKEILKDSRDITYYMYEWGITPVAWKAIQI